MKFLFFIDITLYMLYNVFVKIYTFLSGGYNMVQFDEKLINAEKQKIQEAYAELGELYHKLHKKDYDKELETPFSKIKAAEKAIERHKTEVLKKNGLMLCKHCGSQIQDISRFCNFCGKSVDEPVEIEEEPAPEPAVEPEPAEVEAVEEKDEAVQEERPVVCPKCGEPVEDDFDFCTNCGSRITKPDKNILEPDENKRVCRVCGSALADDMIFCEECGTRVDSEETVGRVFDNVEVQKKVCPICGFSTTDKEVNFCVECGAKLQ